MGGTAPIYDKEQEPAMAPVAHAPVAAVAVPRQLDAQAALYNTLTAKLIPLISQSVRQMTVDWPLEAVEARLSGAEVSSDTYDTINRFGGLLPPVDTKYGCVFFTFRLRQERQVITRRGQKATVMRLFVENVELSRPFK